MNKQMMRTAAGLAIPITIAVAVAFGVGAYIYSQHHFSTLVGSARESAISQGEVILEALEHQMLEKDQDLIRTMVSGFGGRADVESLEILDHEGVVWHSSDPGNVGTVISSESRTCRACHLLPPSQRASSQIVQTDDQSLLRVVLPLRNQEACQSCHDPAQGINGLLILDNDVGAMRASMDRDLRWMVAGSALLAFVLVGTVAGIVQVLVLRRLHRFERAARSIAEGDLDQRVPAAGSDTISWLGREFNSMADSVTGLLREVGHQRERLETVINSIDDGIVVLDPSRRIVAANTAFLERTGHDREEVLGCSCSHVAADSCSATDCPTLACLATGEPQARICSRNNDSDKLVWEEVHSSPVHGPGGEIAQVVEVWRDISARRAAEARLAESHRLASLGMLASGFSHEMSTPLGTVLTCLEGILREVQTGSDALPGSQGISDSATIAREQIMRCRGITQHFLRLSRGQPSPGEVVDLESVLDAVVRLVEPTSQARQVKVEIGSFSPTLKVRVNEADLQHALINLLLNSIEACGPDGRVTVDVEDQGGLKIRVTDNGRGIPPHELGRIFEPFVSLKKGGTGLGLFLALNFVRQWQGDIHVKSELGSGSAFEIVLPGISASDTLSVLS
ncbi:MAG: PAS domain-containing protein [Gemmatimonadetes bacterium]|nr:PAS domain-containing protein [Gemmatimonadota bacterium]NNM07307.1 PAS domain-containing protein [Gemmatimonadota bacterium]